jgi:TonB family protein
VKRTPKEVKPAMFSQLSSRGRGQQIALAVSLALHCALLAWVLRPPQAIFIAPSSARAGLNGRGTTYIYWPTNAGTEESQATSQKSRLTWKKAEREKLRQRELQKLAEAKLAEAEAARKAATASAAAAGSAYGSSLTGSTLGEEVRPALRVAGSEPRVETNDFSGREGNVVIEITIDERGNIVQKKLLESLSPAADQKVLAALEDWRFQPATRDGVAIPSKEDVYYHFPVRR